MTLSFQRLVFSFSLYFFLISFVFPCFSLTPGAPFLWPKPNQIHAGEVEIGVIPESFLIILAKPSNQIVNDAVMKYSSLFFPFLNSANNSKTTTLTRLFIDFEDNNDTLDFPMNEEYSITIKQRRSGDYVANLHGKTYLGVLRGLETFSQLIIFQMIITPEAIKTKYIYLIKGVPLTIIDFPRFPWRGLLFDSSRHFGPLSEIFHLLDVMSWTKLNVFHWHITDSQSFPLEIKKYPKLVKGAYVPEARYSQEDVKKVVSYATSLGIMVVPEIDLPGHSLSWSIGYPNLTVSCTFLGHPDAALNIGQDFTYEVIEAVLNETTALFPSRFFHLGIDEVPDPCWNSADFISNSEPFLKKHHLSRYNLQEYFFKYLFDKTSSFGKIPVIWEELISTGSSRFIPNNTIIEAWKSWGPSGFTRAISLGFQVLLATNWYLDWDKSWDFHYTINDIDLQTATELTLGGEACMWSEYVDVTSREIKIWPNAAAVAERLWTRNSEPTTMAINRLEYWRCHVLTRGVRARPLMPDYCPSILEEHKVYRSVIHEKEHGIVFNIEKIVDVETENETIDNQPNESDNEELPIEDPSDSSVVWTYEVNYALEEMMNNIVSSISLDYQEVFPDQLEHNPSQNSKDSDSNIAWTFYIILVICMLGGLIIIAKFLRTTQRKRQLGLCIWIIVLGLIGLLRYYNYWLILFR